ncbi:MAG: protein jag [Clostridia bacterium]|nr:protein jag [Clostridia bacterium]
MKKEVITSAKTIEEAVALAVKELGAPGADKIEYTVLEEPKKGLFGIGAQNAKISATYTEGGEARALEFIEKLLADMSITAEVSMTDGDNGEKRISVNGESAAILIGHHGDTLDSLQYLANLAANKRVDGKKDPYVKITVDVEGYRAKREETLRALARRMAAKVQKYKKSVMLEPMNPYERRIIHSEIQNIDGVSTNSIGSENNRKIVIFLETSNEA